MNGILNSFVQVEQIDAHIANIYDMKRYQSFNKIIFNNRGNALDECFRLMLYKYNDT